MIQSMHFTGIDGQLLRAMLTAGYNNLKKNIALIDSLNVFPVPDGDTGTNMSLTWEGGLKALALSDAADVDNCLQIFARGALLNARGNSGVILSQFVRGLADFSKGLESFSINDFTAALASGTAKAYSAVIKPTEGTMLTVMRQTAEFAKKSHNEFDSFLSFFTAVIGAMQESLQHTPELLPVLKEAGVVDSGGAGLLCIFEGMLCALNGEKPEDITFDVATSAQIVDASSTFRRDSVLEFGYCTEFILRLMDAKVDIDNFEIKTIIGFLEINGDSIVAIKDDDLVKVHVHTFSPGDILNYCQRFGEFISIKIENMSVQHSEGTAPAANRQKYAVVSVCSGDGIKEYFSNIGVSYIIDGGQTQNPPMEDFIKAYDAVNADDIFVLPNNSNIILVARQSAEHYKNSTIHIIPTKSIAEGYSALSMMDLSHDSADEIIADMEYALGNVSTALVTRANRDATYNGLDIREGKFIGLDKETIYSCEETLFDAACKLTDSIEDIENKQVITLFYGENTTEDDVFEFFNYINEKYPLIETGAIYGGQKIYDFIMAIE